MNSKLEEQLEKVIEKSIEIAEQTGEFVINEGTDLLRQFFLWHTCKHAMLAFIGVLLIVTGRFLMYAWTRKADKDEKTSYDEAKIFGRIGEAVSTVISFVIPTIVGVLMVLVEGYQLLYVLVAPKLYLVDYFIK